jgi:hypothetical protein
MKREMTVIVWVFSAAWVAVCAGQEQPKPDAAHGQSEQRLELIRRRVEELTAVGPKKEKIEFSKQPMLRYNDAARSIADAALWSLGPTGRPRAVLVLEAYTANFMQYELTAIADPPQSVRARGFTWSPRQTPFTWTQIPDFDPPRATSSLRRRQIKQVSQQFSGSEQWRGQTIQLNLQARPILEYEDKELGVLDGAVFVWAHGTNVEILMFIEARRGEAGAGNWVAGFARLASASLEVNYKGNEFWSSAEAPTASPTSPYFFHTDASTPDEVRLFTPNRE